MGNELAIKEENRPAEMVEIEQARAISEVQAALVIAKKFPRDMTAAFNELIEACKRTEFAKIATYSYPKGGQTVSDASIRMAEVMAQSFGNIEHGVREIGRRPGVSICEAYCWDMQKNTRERKQFEVPHEYMAKGVLKKLTDPRDIYELIANQGARRKRACILGVIPQDFKVAALKQVRETLISSTKNRPIEDTIREMVVAFKSSFQVTQEMIEKLLKHSVAEMTREELFDMQGIFNSLKDGHTKRSDWFEVGTENRESSSLGDKLKEQAAKKAEEKKEDAPAADPKPKSDESKVEEKPKAAPAPEPKPEPKKEDSLKEAIKARAGEIFVEYPRFKGLKLKAIKTEELYEELEAIEQAVIQKGRPLESTLNFYNLACQFLDRKKTL